MSFDTFIARFHAAISGRKIFTNDELRAAHADYLDPENVALQNDELAAEYDAVLAAEATAYGY